jgi:hypothetical protein
LGNLPQLEHEIYGDAAEENFSFGCFTFLSDFELFMEDFKFNSVVTTF